jgi:hypothetical protein
MARDGKQVSAFDHNISIPELRQDQTVHLYLVNQSSLISKFSFPNVASTVIAGSSQRMRVSLIRPQVTIQNVLPWFGLSPATYNWQGVPGAP